MKTKFFLRKGSSKNTINFEFRSGSNIKFRPSTGFAVKSERDWDSARQKMKSPSSTLNASLINSKLSEFDNLLNDLIYHKTENGISLEAVTRIFNQVFDLNVKNKIPKNIFKLDPTAEILDNNFIAYYEWFLVFYAKNNSPYSRKILTKGTLATLKSSLNVIKDFMVFSKIKTLTFNDINRQFYNNFFNYLTNEKKYTKNYIGTVIQKLKTVMGYAYDEDKHTNLEYKKNYFSKVSEVLAHPYLNEEELSKIGNLILNSKELDTSRDLFLIACNTGLRIGDLLDFIKKPRFISQEGTKFIQISQKKTATVVFIPVNKKIQLILDKRDGDLPKYIHQNTINRHIKEICKLALIEENYKYTRTEGGIEVEHSEPKYNFICTHTARRSFCTNAYYSGMPPHDIMAISGHRTEKIFFNYIKVEKQVNAMRISKYAFLQ